MPVRGCFVARGLVFTLCCLLILGCSSKKNTALTRFYHNLTTRYNVYYNGKKAYDEALENSEKELRESYILPLPVDPVYYLVSTGQVTSLYDRALEKGRKAIEQHSLQTKPERREGWRRDPKMRAFMEQKEYNSFLKHAWLLVGLSQYRSGAVLEAIATFGYMEQLYDREAPIRQRAMLWQARCYNQLAWFVDSRKVLDRLKNVQLEGEDKLLYQTAMLELLIGEHQTEKAAALLSTIAADFSSKRQRARGYYLLGQLYEELKEPKAASQAYRKVLSYSPPIEMDVSARLREISLSGRSLDRKIMDYRSLAAKGRYLHFQDAIMLPLGEAYLVKGDTLQARRAFQRGVDSSRTKGLDYALARVALGRIALGERDYRQAYTAFENVLNYIPTNYPGRKEIGQQAEALDSVIRYARPLIEADSLAYLASLPEPKLKAHIDSLIQIAEKERIAAETEALKGERTYQEVGGAPPKLDVGLGGGGNGAFYFYNPQLLERGKRLFRERWGNIPLGDNWALDKNISMQLRGAPTAPDSIAEGASGAVRADDPLSELYYLKQIPLLPEQKKANEAVITHSLLGLGGALMAYLGDYAGAIHYYGRLVEGYPHSLERKEAIDRLMRLYLSRGNMQEAEAMRQLYLKDYPDDRLSAFLEQSSYLTALKEHVGEGKKRLGEALELYKSAQYTEAIRLVERSLRELGLFDERNQMLLIGAMSAAALGEPEQLKGYLKQIDVETSTEELASLRGELLAALAAGRLPQRGLHSALGSDEVDPLEEQPLAEVLPPFDPSGEHQLLLLAPAGRYPIGELLFEATAFNYKWFTQQQLKLSVRSIGSYEGLLIEGIDKRWPYFSLAYSSQGLLETSLRDAILLPISRGNLELLKAKPTRLLEYIDYLDGEMPQELYLLLFSRSEQLFRENKDR